ncbi:MAG: hypothetical protein KTR30_24325 [Saprospiraceae bacterium]|nr:hypothetical protein [Saprospiraceae bacterium]
MRQLFVYWWYIRTTRKSYAADKRSFLSIRFSYIEAWLVILLLAFWLFPHFVQAETTFMPSIYLGNDAANPEPCTCLNNATTSSDGQFSTIISITGPSNQIWTITDVNGLYTDDSPAPPEAPTPIADGLIIPEVSDGLYQLAVRHIEGIGFSVVVNNGIDSELKAEASCSYPDPQFVNLLDEYCVTSLPTLLEVDLNGAVGNGEFRINGDLQNTFDPFELGPGTHEVSYTFDAGMASSEDPSDSGCMYTISRKVEVLGVPSLGANFKVQVPLGPDCASVIVPDMILEGTYPCIDTDYLVNVLDPDGIPIGNTVTGEYAGETLMVVVSSIAGGLSTMGRIEIVDNTDPVSECPAAVSSITVEQPIQFLEGDLSANDASFLPTNFSCLLDQVDTIGGFHYFDLDTIRPATSDLYTFEFMADFGRGLAILFPGEFNALNGPCQGYAALGGKQDNSQGFFVGEQNVIGFSAFLEAGELYTILTSSANFLTEGDYSWAIHGTGPGSIENLLTTEEELVLPLFCTDDTSFLQREESLLYTGEPIASDNCSAVDFTFTDELIDGGDCFPKVIQRQFTIMDENGNETSCNQTITFGTLTQSDIIPPSKFTTIDCDEDFAINDEGNPTPDYTGFPMVRTFAGAFALRPSICNLTATYDDQMAMTSCGGSRVFNRRWFFFDECDPGNPVFYDQVIFLEDQAAPKVDADLSNIEFETSALDCEAQLTIPLPEVSDNCSAWEVVTQVIRDDGSEEILLSISAEADREVTLPLGCHIVRYFVTDECGNQSIADFSMCTNDDQEPVAVCDDNLIVSLGGSGLGFLEAEDVDEGSEDNCGIDEMLIRRMYERDPSTCDSVEAYWTERTDEIAFSCCDAGEMVMVELMVTDIFGNDNRCMTFVSVTDKADPDCTPPDDVSVTCSFLAQDFDPTDTTQLDALFGSPTGSDNCSSFTATELAPIVDLDACGAGTIERFFVLTDEFGNRSEDECKQTVSISAAPGYTIKFPQDVFQECSAPLVDTLEIIQEGCESLVINIKDEVFQTSEACKKIFRTYRIEDQCIHTDSSDPVIITRNEDCDEEEGEEAVWVVISNDTAFVDRDGDPYNATPGQDQIGGSCGGINPAGHWRSLPSTGYWEYTQEIVIFDLIAPTVELAGDTLFCSDNLENCSGSVDVQFTVTEACSPEGTSLRAWIDLNEDGNLDGEIPPEDILGIFPTYRITGQFPLGEHAFRIEVTDGCDNPFTIEAPFEVVDCQVNTPSCRLPFSVELLPLDPPIDADGDLDEDLAALSILATTVLTANIDDCTGPVRFSIHKTIDIDNGQVIPDPNEEAVVLTCDDVDETVEVQVYAWDSAENPILVQPNDSIGGPNFSFCTTTITVINSEPICNPNALVSFSGEVMTAELEPVQGVMLEIGEDMPMYGPTNLQGNYLLENLDATDQYVIRPEMNYDFNNGVSTIDLVIISRHILGDQELTSPYKIIAADINRSNTVTTLDVVLLRQLILGLRADFGGNASWRFIDEDYQFPNPNNPWSELFPESIKVDAPRVDQENLDFIAVKIGDVNGNAIPNQLEGLVPRQSEIPLLLEINNQEIKQGDLVNIQIQSSQLDEVLGFQGTLHFDTEALAWQGFESAVWMEEHMNLNETTAGLVPFSWHNEGNTTQELLVSLRFLALKDGQLKDWLNLSNRITPLEGYLKDGTEAKLGLSFRKGESSSKAESMQLMQNRPNPFSQETLIPFFLPEAGPATLSFFDLNGRLLHRINGTYNSGYHEESIAAYQLQAEGLIYYRLESKDVSITQKMIYRK